MASVSNHPTDRSVAFSIVVPSLNSAETIQRCLNSIQSQTYSEYEVVLADGGSRDSTLQIARAYQDERMLISSEEDHGLFDGMNRGISLTRGQWVLVLGSDDELFCPYTLEQAFHLLCQRGSGCWTAAYGDAFIRGTTGWAQDGETYMGVTNLPLLIRKNICQQAIFYYGPTIRRHELQFNHYLNVNGGDHACNIRLWCLQPFVYLPITVCVFHGGGTSSFRPTHYLPASLLEPSFWPPSTFALFQRLLNVLRCWLAWKLPRVYRLATCCSALLNH